MTCVNVTTLLRGIYKGRPDPQMLCGPARLRRQIQSFRFHSFATFTPPDICEASLM